MTTRRQFIKGSVAAAVAASLPGEVRRPDLTEESLEEMLNCIEQGPRPVFLPMVGDADTGMYRASDDTLQLVVKGQRYAKALAHSMQHTKDAVVADVYEHKVYGTESFEDVS